MKFIYRLLLFLTFIFLRKRASCLRFLITPSPVIEVYVGETVLFRWDFYTDQSTVKTVTRWGLVEENKIKTLIADRLNRDDTRILEDWKDRVKTVRKASLELAKLKISDSGVYGCEVDLDQIGTLFNTTKLTVLERPTRNTVDPAYVAVICLVAVMIILIIVYFCLERKKGQRLHKKEVKAEFVPDGYAVPMDTLNDHSREYDIIPVLSESIVDKWEIPKENIIILKVIGKGAFGLVAKGIITVPETDSNRIVAVKMLKSNATDENQRDLLAELELMKTLDPHPNVIQLFGCCTDTDPVKVITEYAPHGDLLGYLRKSRGLNDTYYEDPDIKPRSSLSTKLLFSFAWQTANGMDYLSSKKIVHRDLAARNILVGEEEICKITDFGLARDVQNRDIYNRTSKGRLPVKWTAYESLLYGKCTSMSDVWSYGIVLYEIFTIGGNPYPKMDGPTVAAKLQEGYRMPKPRHLEDKLYNLMKNCWETKPVLRPKFAELCQTFKTMENAHSEYVNLDEYDANLYNSIEEVCI